MRDGEGIYHFKGGARYDGEWQKGLKHGRGKFTYPDGSTYCGHWKKNMKHGFGKYTYENGDYFEGNWRKDVRYGVGSYKFKEADISIKATWFEGTPKGPIEIFYPNFRYHGYWNKQNPVGLGVFSFGKYMLRGNVNFYPNPEFGEGKDEDRESQQVEENDKECVDDSVPKCLPQFIAHDILPYDYSKLPQQPMQLPTADSVTDLCSESSKSDIEIQIFQVQSPILITADPVFDEFEGSIKLEIKCPELKCPEIKCPEIKCPEPECP